MIAKLSARSFLFVSLLLGAVFVWSVPHLVLAVPVSPPNIIGYQGRLLDTNGSPIADVDADIQFKIFDGDDPDLDNCLWANDACVGNTAETIDLTDGLFSVLLGDVAAGFTAIDDTVFSDNATTYLQVIVNGEALTPLKRLGAVPYALNAQTLDGLSAADLVGASDFEELYDTDDDDTLTTDDDFTLDIAGSLVFDVGIGELILARNNIRAVDGAEFQIGDDGSRDFTLYRDGNGTYLNSFDGEFVFTQSDVDNDFTFTLGEDAGVTQYLFQTSLGTLLALGTDGDGEDTYLDNSLGELYLRNTDGGINFDVDQADVTEFNVGTASNDGFDEVNVYSTTTVIGGTGASDIYLGQADNAYILKADMGDLEVDIAGDLQIDMTGFFGAATTNGVCHTGADEDAQAFDRYLVVCSNAPGDIAEWYVTDGATAGELVVAGDSTVTYAEKLFNPRTGEQTGEEAINTISVLVETAQPYQAGLLGIVSTSPYQTVGSAVQDLEGSQPIALIGRVPTKVSTENGAIAPGDPITSSSVAGVGMKATRSGAIVGYALQSYNGPGVGTTMVYVQPGWFQGALVATDEGTTLADRFILTAEEGADQQHDSSALILRGAAWNALTGNEDAVQFSLQQQVTSTENYALQFLNNEDESVLSLAQNGDLTLSGRLFLSDRGVSQQEKYLFYDGSEGVGGDFIRTNAAGWGTGSYDFAEMFPSNETLEAGEVVVFDATSNEHITRAAAADTRQIAGIISTRPGFLAGENLPGHYPLALAGRVPTRTTTEAGPVAIGDALTVSATRPGYAMKASNGDAIVGYALEPLTETNGSIVVFVEQGTASLPTAEASSFVPDVQLATLSLHGDLFLQGNDILSVARLNTATDRWSIDEEGNIVTRGLIKTAIDSYQGDVVETTVVTSPDVTITLTGTIELIDGAATVRFERINPEFNDVIDVLSPLRVFITPSSPIQVYVTQKSTEGFTVLQEGGTASGVAIDWIVVAYRRDHLPADQEPITEADLAEDRALRTAAPEETQPIPETDPSDAESTETPETSASDETDPVTTPSEAEGPTTEESPAPETAPEPENEINDPAPPAPEGETPEEFVVEPAAESAE